MSRIALQYPNFDFTTADDVGCGKTKGELAVNKAVIMLALLSTLAPAAAQKAAEKESLTVEQALIVKAGLEALSKFELNDKDGKPTTGYYKFSADTTMLIALNIDLGRRLESSLATANNSIVMQKSDGSGSVPEARRGEYNIEYRKLLEAPSRVGFYRIKAEDLCLELTPKCQFVNPIPVSVLASIIPIIDR